MKQNLHLLTRVDDELAATVIEAQRQSAETTVVVLDLTGSEPDYAAALRLVFAADSVAVW